MRAVGYVAPHLAANTSDDAQDPVSWSAVVEPSAGSWGAAETGRVTAEPRGDGPAERIVAHCANGGHNLVAIFGVDGGSASLMEQLGLPQHAAQDDASDDTTTATPADEPQFLDLLAALTPPAGHPALVVIHDASHLAADVEQLIRRLITIRRTGSDAQCTDPDRPDPLLSGLSLLPLTAEDAQEAGRDADGADGRDDDDAHDAHAHADRDSDAGPAGRRAGVPKVIELASSGRVLGRTPYGYRASAEGTLEPVQHEAQVVRRVFSWYTGQDGRAAPIGMRMIVQRLHDNGMRTRAGKPWSTAAISLMLKNKVYVGTYERYGFLVAGNHEPLIDRSLFNAAQGRMSKPSLPSALPDPEPEATFLLGGLVRCGGCGHGIPGLSRKRAWRRRDGTVASRLYRYYEFAECPQRRRSRDARARARTRAVNINDDTELNGDSDADGAAAEAAVCPSWRADDLEDLAKERIAQLAPDALDTITPRDADSDVGHQFGGARREFAAAVRLVAIGKGDLEHLMPELDALADTRRRLHDWDASAERRALASRSRLNRIVRDHVANLAADVDWQTSREALVALVDHVSVTDDDATVVTHAG